MGKGQDWGFSLFFLSTLPPGTPLPPPDADRDDDYSRMNFEPVLELTHNHGTELKEEFK